jgi:hypothetical protein
VGILKKMFTNFNNQARTIEETIEDFLNNRKGKKANETITFYEQRLYAFNVYLQEEEGVTEIFDISRLKSTDI